MPKKRGRSRSRLRWIPVNSNISLTTLGDDTVLKGAFTAVGRDAYAVVAKGQWAIRDHTANEGPITVGFAHNDLSVTEIEEKLDANASSDPDDIIANEHRKRPVKTSGVFAGNDTEEVLNLGNDVSTPLRFSVGNGHSVAMWAKNQSGGPLTTGTVLRFTGLIGYRFK